jgi:glycine oxidase
MLETVVIGAGIAGFSVAFALWERGAAVTIVETRRPGSGATGASAGMLAAQYEAGEDGPKFRLCLESRSRYPEFARRLQAVSGHNLPMRWVGMLVANLTADEHEGAVESVAWQRDAGLEAQLLAPGEAERIQPGISQAALSYVWLPSEGWLDSQLLGDVMREACARSEIRLITGNSAAEILTEAGAVVGVLMADGRTLSAERVVLAAGAFSGGIGGLPWALPVRPVRGQMLRFGAGTTNLQRLVTSHAGRYLVPRDDGSVLAGSTMEDVGFDRAITDDAARLIQRSVSQLYPGLSESRPIEQWAGLRPICVDSLPVFGPDPVIGGLLYATGYGRDGVLVSPLAGTVVAELAIEGSSQFDWGPFSPARFAGRRAS